MDGILGDIDSLSSKINALRDAEGVTPGQGRALSLSLTKLQECEMWYREYVSVGAHIVGVD